ncbi:hypothetical protein [Streptomyces sp. NPDC059564]|uniref:hypothetical protein n=1 Tax=Streptomyces sp. NPDC059564 TaxID=3346865 RepID=UPI0036B7F9FC
MAGSPARGRVVSDGGAQPRIALSVAKKKRSLGCAGDVLDVGGDESGAAGAEHLVQAVQRVRLLGRRSDGPA